MTEKKFNPSEYKSYNDLPSEKKEDFVPIDEKGSFIKKEVLAYENRFKEYTDRLNEIIVANNEYYKKHPEAYSDRGDERKIEPKISYVDAEHERALGQETHEEIRNILIEKGKIKGIKEIKKGDTIALSTSIIDSFDLSQKNKEKPLLLIVEDDNGVVKAPYNYLKEKINEDIEGWASYTRSHIIDDSFRIQDVKDEKNRVIGLQLPHGYFGSHPEDFLPIKLNEKEEVFVDYKELRDKLEICFSDLSEGPVFLKEEKVKVTNKN